MIYLICMTVFALAFWIKGGVIEHHFPNYERARDKNHFTRFLLSHKTIAIFIILIFSIATFSHPLLAVTVTLGWWASIVPSLGEEHGAIGYLKRAAQSYLDDSITHRGRMYDVKKGLQRGIFGGAAMTIGAGVPSLLSGNVLPAEILYFILSSLLYVPCVWIGATLYHLVTGRESWSWSEPLIGAVVYGLPIAMFMSA